MASELAPIDISNAQAPSLPELVDEVRRTNRPRAIRADGEVVATIVPTKPRAKRTYTSRSRGQEPSLASLAGGAGTLPQGTAAPTRYTLESAFGSVPTPPHLQGRDIEVIIREATEDYAERVMHD